MQLNATTLAAVTDVGFEFTPTNAGCGGTGNGVNSISGTLSGTTLKLTVTQSGNTFTFNGTYNSTATPPIQGTVTGAAGNSSNCANFTANVTGVVASSLTGTYTGPDGNGGTVTANVTEDSNANLKVSVNDSTNGNGSGTGTATANALNLAITFPGHSGNNGNVFGYFDPGLGTKGSIILMNLKSGCNDFDDWCLAAGPLAKQ